MNAIVAQKKELRTTMFQQRNSLSAIQKMKYDSWICDELEQLILSINCKVVHAYLPMGSEIDINPLLKSLLAKKITVVTPKTLKNRQLEQLVLHSLDKLEDGIFGTQHPAESSIFEGDYDCIIVPGLAFDMQNYRLGYGGGYYDGFLAQHSKTFTVGICYPFQQMKSIPKEIHDVCLSKVLVKELL